MIRVTIDSIRVSLISPHRIVVLREEDGERHVPIWVGPNEAEALSINLRGTEVPRPLTHDLLKQLVVALDATVSHILISDLRDEVYYATIVIEADGRVVEVDARPSDAINLAVRTSAAIFVAERVLDAAGIKPESSLDTSGEEDEDLSVFADFVESLDLDDLGDE